METRKYFGVSSIRRSKTVVKEKLEDGKKFVVVSNIMISNDEFDIIIKVINKSLKYNVPTYGHIITRDILNAIQIFSSVRVSANDKGSEWLIELSTNYREFE